MGWADIKKKVESPNTFCLFNKILTFFAQKNLKFGQWVIEENLV